MDPYGRNLYGWPGSYGGLVQRANCPYAEAKPAIPTPMQPTKFRTPVSRAPLLMATAVAGGLAVAAAFVVRQERHRADGSLAPFGPLPVATMPRSDRTGAAAATETTAVGLEDVVLHFDPDGGHPFFAAGLTLANQGTLAAAVAEQLKSRLTEWLGSGSVATGPMPEPGATVVSPTLGIFADANVRWTPTSARALVVVTWIAIDSTRPVPWPDIAAYRQRGRGGEPLEWINNPTVRGTLFSPISFEDEVDSPMTPEQYSDHLAAEVADRIMNEVVAYATAAKH